MFIYLFVCSLLYKSHIHTLIHTHIHTNIHSFKKLEVAMTCCIVTTKYATTTTIAMFIVAGWLLLLLLLLLLLYALNSGLFNVISNKKVSCTDIIVYIKTDFVTILFFNFFHILQIVLNFFCSSLSRYLFNKIHKHMTS